IRRALPQERIVYLGDTARVPYGSKSGATVIRYALEDSAFLVKHQVKMLVVACNTASAYSLKTLQERFPLPTIGVVEPGAKAAVAVTKGKIGVIGTEGTIHSEAYPEAIRRLNPNLSVFSQACPLFVPLVEEGWVENEVARKVAEQYLSDLRRDQIDTLVLGCTHYPLLKQTIRQVMGNEVHIIDSAEAVCTEIISVLEEKGLRRTGGPGEARIFVTDLPQRFERVGRLFLGGDLPPVNQVDLV
ncbi:MAG: glutamate racemase, partial [candidate division NC10 bacterium]|nr:glutamate racemase [candidate division NC10 bacterium]